MPVWRQMGILREPGMLSHVTLSILVYAGMFIACIYLADILEKLGGFGGAAVRSAAEEAVVVEYRRRTLLPLDDLLGSLRENVRKLSRSALHRRLVRHGISRLPAGDPAAKRKRFAATTDRRVRHRLS